MDSREMLIAFEELIRTADPNLEFDVNLNNKVVYLFLSKAQEAYVAQNFLIGDSIQDNINAIRKRSDVLRKIINRSDATVESSANKTTDGGYIATIDETDYWMFLSGVLTHSNLPVSDKGSTLKVLNLNLINHYDLEHKIRTVNNEPIIKDAPMVLEGNDKFIFYLSKENDTAIGATIDATTFDIIYLAYPTAITEDDESQLAISTHYNIVELAANSFMKEYKYLLGTGQIKQSK